MSTIGENLSMKPSKTPRAPSAWKDVAKGAGCMLGSIAVCLAALFALAYLVTLAVRLGWGS